MIGVSKPLPVQMKFIEQRQRMDSKTYSCWQSQIDRTKFE